MNFRFKTLTRNIRCRRGEKVAINLPVFQDDNTKDPHEILVEKYGAEAAKASKPGHIYMDAMGFGMGQSCLQVSKARNQLSFENWSWTSAFPALQLQCNGVA